ncbi:unnamed protein product [Prorocentrum cordatum]|uniref:Uncharacterized protein n=1 Tax=Prorocentrum cordatum TaxID=2364126 RepID=A0ABN9UQP1_9DINO|nr:unnamed protein product [Polarella glacialis]
MIIKYLASSLEKFDVNLDNWADIPDRASAGIRTPYGYTDMIIMPVTYGTVQSPSFWEKLKTFSVPLEGPLWGLFLVIALLTSLAYFFLERDESGDGWTAEGPDGYKIEQNIVMGLTTLTQVGTFTPRTMAGKVFILTFTFFIMI